MKEMKTLTFPNGETYEIVDSVARQALDNKSQTIDDSTTKYPSNKAVKDYVDEHGGGGGMKLLASVITSEEVARIVINFDKPITKFRAFWASPAHSNRWDAFCDLKMSDGSTRALHYAANIETTNALFVTDVEINGERVLYSCKGNRVYNAGTGYLDRAGNYCYPINSSGLQITGLEWGRGWYSPLAIGAELTIFGE